MRLNIQRFAVTKSTTFAESDISIENNTSTLKITIRFSPNNDSTYFSSKTLNCTCNGVKKTASVSLSKGGYVSKTFTFTGIKHNTDGTKSVSWSWSCATGTSVLGTISASGTKTLTTIQRYGEIISVVGDTTNSTITFNWRTYVADWEYDLYIYHNNNESGFYHLYNNIGSSVGEHSMTFSVGNDYFNNYQAETTLPIFYSLKTEIDGIYKYTDYKETTINLNWSALPTISIGTLTEAGDVPSNWGVFVQNKSKLNIPTTSNGAAGSKIERVINNNGSLYYKTTTPSSPLNHTFTTNYLTTSGSNTISINAYDTRNRQSLAASSTYNVVAYSNPTIATAQAQRCLQDGTLDNEGTYVKFSFSGSVSPVSNHNDSYFRISYKKENEGNYTDVLLSTSYTYNQSNVVSSFTISPDYTYDIKFSVEDSFTTTEIVRTLDTGFDLMNFNPSGKAMAIGKTSEAGANEELLEVALPTRFIPNTDVYSAVDIMSSNRNEASIGYSNETKTKRYVAGYGTASYDGFGIWADETAQNILTINKDGQLNLADDTSWTQLTMESGFQQVSWNPLKVKRKCGIVQIIGMFEITSMTSWIKPIAYLPSGFKPYNEINVVCRNANGGLAIIAITSQGIFWLNQDGVGDISSGTIVLTATYIGES